MRALIIGGSVSGLACAESLLERSCPSALPDVVVVDAKSRIGENPRCAGGLSLFMAQKVGFEIPESSVVARVKRVRIYAPDMTFWELKGEEYGVVLNREVFEQKMAERVEALGGRMKLGKLISITELESLNHEYEYIVGADGSASIVRRWLNQPNYSPDDIHVGIQKTLTMDQYPQDTIELYFGEKVAPQGYAWIFPAGNGLVRIGLGIPSSKGWLTKDLLEHFILRQTYDYKEINSIGKLIPAARTPKLGVHGRFLLVGDALPSTDPLTGGGISQAIFSGKAAGRALADRRPENYDGYMDWLRRQNNRRYRIKLALCKFSDQDYIELIRVMHGFKPKTLSVGKELRRAVIHLILRKPSLLRKFF